MIFGCSLSQTAETANISFVSCLECFAIKNKNIFELKENAC